MQTKSWPTSITVDPFRPSSAFLSLPGHVERKINRRWKEWEPWAIVHLHHTHFDMTHASTELARLRERHRQHVLDLLQAGIEMRLIRRHRLDDPRITDEGLERLARAAIERRRKVSAGAGSVSYFAEHP